VLMEDRSWEERVFIYASMLVEGWGPGTHIAAPAYSMFFPISPEKQHHCVVSKFLDRAVERKEAGKSHAMFSCSFFERFRAETCMLYR
jgi:hypothetical protein